MSSESETQHVRCTKCKKILKCSPYDTVGLMEHVRECHPKLLEEFRIDVGKEQPRQLDRSQSSSKLQPSHKSSKECGQCAENRTPIGKQSGTTVNKSADEAERYASAQNSQSTCSNASAAKLSKPDSKELRQLQKFRNSIHEWMPPDGRIFCPKCCARKPPSIQTRLQLQSNNNGCCAQCVFSCWPFCFLPCLLPHDNREYLHCANCKSFLGIYYREKNTVRPNRDYVIGKCD